MSVSRPKRVLFLDHTAAMGGGEIALFNLVRHLDRTRYEPVVCLFSNGPLAVKLREAAVELHVLPLDAALLNTRKDSVGLGSIRRIGALGGLASFALRLARLIRSLRVDVVHANSLKADILGGIAARLAGTKLIWHVRDRIDEDYLPKPAVVVFRWLCRAIPHAVIANSAATLATLRLRNSNRRKVVYSGVDLSNQPAADVGAAELARSELARLRRSGGTPCERHPVVHDGIALDDFIRTAPSPPVGTTRELIVGLVGRITRWKGQHVFIRAAAIVHRRFPAVRFRIVGAALFDEQEYDREIRELTRALGLTDVVDFAGFRNDVAWAIAELDILVHASVTAEPFGQVIIEGMASGKPVIATAGGGALEIVDDGVTGRLVPMGDHEAMAAAICRLLEDPSNAAAMGRAGLRRVREQFSIGRTCRNVEALYSTLLS